MTRTTMTTNSNFRVSLILLAAIMHFICSTTTTTTVFIAVDAFTTDPSSLSLSPLKSTSNTKTTTTTTTATSTKYDKIRQDWNDRSVSYYSKVMREERRRDTGQIDHDGISSEEYQQDFELSAKKHYFAFRKIKEGRYGHAEIIYKRIIQEIMQEDGEGHCDHAKLAVTTLLLALHCQRMGDMKKTRSVFLIFFREVITSEINNKSNDDDDHDHGEHDQCACSAKVLGAFALFEMKQGNSIKSLEIARKAVEFDPSLGPILEWKQFRDVRTRTKTTKKERLAAKRRDNKKP